MCNMSRKSRFEYIGEKRRAYAMSAKAKRSRILDEVGQKGLRSKGQPPGGTRSQAHLAESPVKRALLGVCHSSVLAV